MNKGETETDTKTDTETQTKTMVLLYHKSTNSQLLISTQNTLDRSVNVCQGIYRRIELWYSTKN